MAKPSLSFLENSDFLLSGYFYRSITYEIVAYPMLLIYDPHMAPTSFTGEELRYNRKQEGLEG